MSSPIKEGVENVQHKENDSNIQVPKEPFSFIFSNYHKDVTNKDLQIIRITAEYFVANEITDLNSLLVQLKESFEDISQFNFCKADHPLNDLFLAFINQYKQIKICRSATAPPCIKNTGKDESSQNEFLQRCFKRSIFNEYAKEYHTEKEEANKLQKIQFYSFNWTKFKVVGKIIVDGIDETTVPEPLDFKMLSLKNINNTISTLFNEPTAFKVAESEPGKKSKRKLNVRGAGETRRKKNKNSPNLSTENGRMIECPITHKMVEADNFDKHLRILLSDPNYKQEREKYEAKHRLTNLTTDEIFENIQRIVQKGK
ncbi:Prp21p NDAI_0D05040 [Naumovozyma dairenensis CBS 421]|uniref:Splicing factor 3A subunit 1 conserved domain-containing protein n=1 Tax=Naumovozyma dairenensis (strain ATCC 10597 / BCRC 20456 / CBS 421 / NBRC 0211 / NRRL Y-12639) TaxID=1071378 RepID=G0WAK6_NAUDC|nr:hypothetical protein NDAI_0D05040 [Naumovozyma dairenensis CBS 421]CCD24817.1 hypothetical protein NDAI_0D05040 [Naumovozyma dairenensis CBS 421]